METFRSAFTQADLIKADTLCPAGQSTKLGEYVVPAGENVSLGYGRLLGQESAEGRIFMDIQDATGAVEGTVRLIVHSAQNRPHAIIHEYRTETLRQNATDRTKQLAFPDSILYVTEDKKIVLEFIADVEKTVSKSKTKILMDITKEVF